MKTFKTNHFDFHTEARAEAFAASIKDFPGYKHFDTRYLSSRDVWRVYWLEETTD